MAKILLREYTHDLFFSDLMSYLQTHIVGINKSQIAENILSEKLQKIPSDLQYYLNEIKYSVDYTKYIFNKYMLFNSVHSLLEKTKLPILAGMKDEDFENMAAIKLGTELAIEYKNPEKERCFEDLFLCDSESVRDSLWNAMDGFCFNIGVGFHGIVEKLERLVSEYETAYSELGNAMEEYRKDWLKLTDNFYQ